MKKFSLFFLIISLVSVSVKAEDNIAKIQALYIYNFLRNVGWPEDVKDEYVIGVTGETAVYDELVKFTQNREIAGKRIKVIKCNNCADLLRCQVIFISKDKCSCLKEINQTLKGKGCLTIFENNTNIISNATIDLIENGTKLSYRINQNVVSEQNLTISHNIVKMSI
ncbi:MAG: YfiR family protein [Bacteroidales bacterium]|nr:YfiR family protein [Bacteroidales bacterium]MBN2820346.1 YfiR family protein [Bacteroidales bacterium]